MVQLTGSLSSRAMTPLATELDEIPSALPMPARPHHRRSSSDPTELLDSYRRKTAEGESQPKRTLGAGSGGASPAHKKVARGLSGDESLKEQLSLLSGFSELPGGEVFNPPLVKPPMAPQRTWSLCDLSAEASEPKPTGGSLADADSRSGDEAEKKDLRKDVPMWTVEEDLRILKLVEQHGKRWSKIAAHLPGRTDNGVRNRWNRMEKAQTLRTRHGSEHGYRCRRCGQPKRGHICAALTKGERPEGEDLSQKAAALTALSAQTMQAVLADKGGEKSPKAAETPAPTAAPAAALLSSTPLSAQASRPMEPAAPAAPAAPALATMSSFETAAQFDPAIPPMDEAQLYSFLNDLDMSLSLEEQANAAPVAAPPAPPPFAPHAFDVGVDELAEMAGLSSFLALDSAPTSQFPSALGFDFLLTSMPVC